ASNLSNKYQRSALGMGKTPTLLSNRFGSVKLRTIRLPFSIFSNLFWLYGARLFVPQSAALNSGSQ
ncbi:MAG: hypothetical protein WBP93_08165, partial [Pyrinomonadaceae bacterium]